MSRRYLAPLLGDIDERDWMLYGQCREVGPYLFFPDPSVSKTTRRRMESEAKSICAHCVVTNECEDWAIRHGEIGVWGGKTEYERRRSQRQTRAS